MKIICVGRNYAEHAKELNNALPTEPVLFMKPDSALLRKGEPFFHPNFSENIHYETEIVFRIKKIGRHIYAKFAHKYFAEYTIGIDFTFYAKFWKFCQSITSFGICRINKNRKVCHGKFQRPLTKVPWLAIFYH